MIFNADALERLRTDLIKFIIVTGASFTEVATFTKRKDNEEPPFGEKESTAYHTAQYSTQRSLRRSYKSFNNGSKQSRWIPLEPSYSTDNFLLPNQLLQQLTQKFLRLSSSSSTSAVPQTMPSSNNSVSSSQDGEVFFSNGTCGHVYFKGTMKDFKKTSEEFKVRFVEAAKAANIGENEALQKMIIILLDKVKDPTNTFNTKALDLTLFGVNVDQYKLFKLGFDTNCFFVQMPVSDNDTLNSVDAVVATIQEMTTTISESARNDAYRQFKESCVNKDGSMAMRVSTSRYVIFYIIIIIPYTNFACCSSSGVCCCASKRHCL